MSGPSRQAPKPLQRKGMPARSEGHHTCILCPVCATEECKILQALGMYCDTACAAFEATLEKRRAHSEGKGAAA
jgi:hypothetical protein